MDLSNYHLQAFLHISTLYSNCDREMIEEKVYESDIAFDKIIQVSLDYSRPTRVVCNLIA